jgi:hypothetical protein
MIMEENKIRAMLKILSPKMKGERKAKVNEMPIRENISMLQVGQTIRPVRVNGCYDARSY